MPKRTPRPCPTCNDLNCTTHTPGHYNYTAILRRRQTVADWITQHGYTCPGYNRNPHPATDLTADHINELATGAPETGPLRVLCRSCNARRSG